jgi:type II secretory pathway pseudopilin PulG
MRGNGQWADKGGDARGRALGAFTLIEVLTVISLITVLLLATLPAFRSARTSAQRNASASEAMEIASATLEFRRVYGSWPCEEEAAGGGSVLLIAKRPTDGKKEKLKADEIDLSDVVHVLLGDDDAKYRQYNPRAIQFLELSRSCLRTNRNDTAAYPYDPWGQPYVLVMLRAVRKGSYASASVNRIEGGLAFAVFGDAADFSIFAVNSDGAHSGVNPGNFVSTPDDAVAFSWGDPMMITNKAAPTRIVGSWSPR